MSEPVRKPCPACPDGSVWDSKGPTSGICPVCKGQAFVWGTTPELPRTDAGEDAGGSRLAASVEGGNNTGVSTGELARFTPDVMCSEDGTHYCGMRPDTKGLWCGHADATAVINLLRARHLKNAIADSQMQDRAEQAEAAFKISDATCSKYIKLLGDAEARVRELEAALREAHVKLTAAPDIRARSDFAINLIKRIDVLLK